MIWLAVVLFGLGAGLAVYCAPFLRLSGLAWSALPGEVRLVTAPHWSAEKAFERWRTYAVLRAEGVERTMRVFPFPADNIFETRAAAEQCLSRLAAATTALKPVRHRILFWMKCAHVSISERGKRTAAIGFAAGIVVAAAGLAAAMYFVTVH